MAGLTGAGLTGAALLGLRGARHPLGDAFLRWQCRVRQIAMRDGQGRPDDAVMPALTLPGAEDPMGHIITLMNKTAAHSKTPEMMHMVKRTADPAQRREKALQFFSETYYQKAGEFSDMLTATFPPGSPGAAQIREAETCRLDFAAYGQAFGIAAKVWRLTEPHPLHAATLWHNRLFNPTLPPDTVVLGFEPDWEASEANPPEH
ncbi:MAG: hypothetical protein AAFR79_14965 [Pseudomonadota bacterium]